MKLVVGHKNLNLEELYDVGCSPLQPEVVVDSQIFAELNPQASQQKETPTVSKDIANLSIKGEHERVILLVKLVQLLKLKKSASKQLVEFILRLLNSSYKPIVTHQLPQPLLLQGNDIHSFFSGFFGLCKDNNITISEKELFIIQAPLQAFQAVFALENKKINKKLPLFDSTLVFSLETLGIHEDYFTPYALTLGKQSVGINNFKNAVLTLTDKSKMLSSNAHNKAITDKLQLNKVYPLHQALHDKVLQLNHQLVSDINSDIGGLFSEKKYKELMAFAIQEQYDLIGLLASQVDALVAPIKGLRQLSQVREQMIRSADTDAQMNEENKQEHHEDILSVFNFLNNDPLFKVYSQELFSAFKKNKLAEDQLVAKATEDKKAEAEASQNQDQKQQKKKKAKEVPTSLQFGKGTRQFFEHLLLFNYESLEEFQLRVDINANKELLSVFDEILESKNEERRKPKCPKGTRDMTPLQMSIRERAFKIIKGVFKKHGATEIDTPVFELKETLTGKYGEDSKLIYDLEDQGGELLSLRYDLTVPFARYVAEKGLSSIKRYHISKVYRRDNPQMAKGRFREFYQCDFDIAGQYSLMIPDAEVLKVLTNILSDLNIGNFLIKLNHRKFLDAIIDISGCEKRKFKAICSSIDKLDKEPWSKVREELINAKGLTTQMTDKLEKFVELKGKPLEMLALLKDKGVFAGHKEGEDTIKEMETLFQYLGAMNCLDKLSFDFSLARGLDYYTGLIYEAVLTDTDRVGSIAGGGRYDTLVGMFSSKSIPAVGVSVGIERIFSILEEKARLDPSVRATETQILIAQIGKNLTTERLKICNELWDKGIKAETLYNDNPKTQKQLEFALESGVPLIMWVGENEVQQGIVKVKSLNKKEEYEIKRSELAERVAELVEANPILLPQEEQMKNGKKQEEVKKD